MIISNQLEDSVKWANVVGVVTEHKRRYRAQDQSKIFC